MQAAYFENNLPSTPIGREFGFCIQFSEWNIPGKRARLPDYLGSLPGRWTWQFESG
jgi:hypothetical protein